MTIETVKKEVREAIIAAVPEISELKFGCRVRCFGEVFPICGKNEHLGAFAMDGKMLYSQKNLENAEFEILGRPITLADVLRAMDTDLSQPLDVQSDEVWRFLHKVLVEK
jgi:hypothetical protein